jgi:hypothetical protein
MKIRDFDFGVMVGVVATLVAMTTTGTHEPPRNHALPQTVEPLPSVHTHDPVLPPIEWSEWHEACLTNMCHPWTMLPLERLSVVETANRSSDRFHEIDFPQASPSSWGGIPLSPDGCILIDGYMWC